MVERKIRRVRLSLQRGRVLVRGEVYSPRGTPYTLVAHEAFYQDPSVAGVKRAAADAIKLLGLPDKGQTPK